MKSIAQKLMLICISTIYCALLGRQRSIQGGYERRTRNQEFAGSGLNYYTVE